MHTNSLDESVTVSNEVLAIMVDYIMPKSNKCYLYNFLYNKKEQRMLSLLKEKGGQDRPSLVHC